MAFPAGENPFRVQRIHALEYRAPAFDWDQIEARWERLGRRAAVIGPHGHGKSTWLRAFAQRMELKGRRVHVLRCDAAVPRFREMLPDALGPRDVVLVDGLDQLSVWDWQRLRWRTRRAWGLLATEHVSRRLPALYACETSPGLLDELLADLLSEDAETYRAEAQRLFLAYQGDLREVFFRLYDQCAGGYGERV